MHLIVIFLIFLFYSRKPFQLNGILVPYNLLMAALNLFICLRLGVAAANLRYNLFCQPCRQIWNRDELKVRKNNHVLRTIVI